MRRLLALLAAAALLMAGCSEGAGQAASPASAGAGPSAAGARSGDASGAPGGGAAGTPAPVTAGGATGPGPSTAATGTGNTAAVCAKARQASATAVTAFFTQLSKQLQASAAGDTAAAKAAGAAARKALKTWQQALTAQAAAASDPALADVLTRLAAQVGQLSTTLDDLDDADFDQVSDELDAICGS